MHEETAVLEKAISLREAGEISASIGLLQKLAKESTQDDKRAVILANLATSLAAKRDFVAARSQVLGALSLLPESHSFRPYAELILASIMQEQGELAPAKKVFEKLLEMSLLRDAEHRELWVDALGRYACLLVALADYHTAVPKLNLAIQVSINPGRLQVLHLNLGIAGDAAGNQLLAEKEYRAATDGPDLQMSVEAQFRLACLFFSQGKFTDSIENLSVIEKSEAEPHLMRDIYTMLSRNYLKVGNDKLGRKYAEMSKRLGM